MNEAITDAAAAQAADTSSAALLKAISGLQVPESSILSARSSAPSRVQLIADRIHLARSISAFEDEDMKPLLLTALTELFQDALASNTPRLDPAPLGLNVSMPEPLVAEEEDPVYDSDSDSKSDVSEAGAVDIYDQLVQEAEMHLPFLVYSLLASAYLGTRLRDLTAGPPLTYTTRADYLLQLRQLEDRVDAIDPDVDAPGYQRLSARQRYQAVRNIALVKYSQDARSVFPEFTPGQSVFVPLRALPVDADENVVVPWRAFASAPQGKCGIKP